MDRLSIPLSSSSMFQPFMVFCRLCNRAMCCRLVFHHCKCNTITVTLLPVHSITIPGHERHEIRNENESEWVMVKDVRYCALISTLLVCTPPKHKPDRMSLVGSGTRVRHSKLFNSEPSQILGEPPPVVTINSQISLPCFLRTMQFSFV